MYDIGVGSFRDSVTKIDIPPIVSAKKNNNKIFQLNKRMGQWVYMKNMMHV